MFIKGGCFTYKGGWMFTEGRRLLVIFRDSIALHQNKITPTQFELSL